jgi:hypothetical protein
VAGDCRKMNKVTMWFGFVEVEQITFQGDTQE